MGTVEGWRGVAVGVVGGWRDLGKEEGKALKEYLFGSFTAQSG